MELRWRDFIRRKKYNTAGTRRKKYNKTVGQKTHKSKRTGDWIRYHGEWITIALWLKRLTEDADQRTPYRREYSSPLLRLIPFFAVRADQRDAWEQRAVRDARWRWAAKRELQ